MLTYLRLYLLPLILLLGVALLEKGIFAYYHNSHFSELGLAQIITAILWGIKFDLAIAGAFAFIAFLIAYLVHRLLRRNFLRALQLTSFLAAATLLVLHGSDLLYYSEAGRHLGYELKEGFNSGGDLATAALQTYTLPVALQLLLLLPLYFLNRGLFRLASRFETSGSHLLAAELALLITLLLSAVMVRGGLGSVPLEPLHAQEIRDTQRATLALNGVYNAVFSSITPYSISPVFSTPPGEEDLAQVRQMLPAEQPARQGEAHHYNVVILLLESWSGAFMQPYGYDRQTTPYFDELRQQSLTTLAMMAGGHRTTEGIFASMCSWQNPLGQTVAQSQLQNYSYYCLPEILHQNGYYTAFFQGTLKNTSGTGAFAQSLGFRYSYGKKDVPDHKYPHNSWGLQDPDLYRFVLQKLKKMPQPFFVGINTNSTHSSELPPGLKPAFEGDDHDTVYSNMLHFSDESLKKFMHEVEQDPAFKDTIFIMVADHAGPSLGNSNINKYLIPFLVYAPGVIEPQQRDIVSSQRDIAPTLLDILGLPASPDFSGVSLLDEASKPYADYYHQGHLGWVEGTAGVEFMLGDKEKAECYTFKPTPFRREKHVCTEQDIQLRRRATAFTHLSQSLLFNGDIGKFRSLIGMR